MGFPGNGTSASSQVRTAGDSGPRRSADISLRLSVFFETNMASPSYHADADEAFHLAPVHTVSGYQFPLRLLFLAPQSRYSCPRNLLFACIRLDVCHEILPLSQTFA